MKKLTLIAMTLSALATGCYAPKNSGIQQASGAENYLLQPLAVTLSAVEDLDSLIPGTTQIALRPCVDIFWNTDFAGAQPENTPFSAIKLGVRWKGVLSQQGGGWDEPQYQSFCAATLPGGNHNLTTWYSIPVNYEDGYAHFCQPEEDTPTFEGPLSDAYFKSVVEPQYQTGDSIVEITDQQVQSCVSATITSSTGPQGLSDGFDSIDPSSFPSPDDDLSSTLSPF